MCSISGYAYYGYYNDSSSMSGWWVFFMLIAFLAALLQVILFFKVWGMTNNVKYLKEFTKRQFPSAYTDDIDKRLFVNRIRQLYFCDKIEEAYEVLNAYVYKKITLIDDAEIQENGDIFVKTDEWDNKSNSYVRIPVQTFIGNIITEFEAIYELIGKNMPSNLKNISYERYIEFSKKALDN